MGWRAGEIWFDLDSLWFRESLDPDAISLEVNAPAFYGLSAEALAAAVPDGLAQSRRRRADLRRRRNARKTRTAAIVVGPAVLFGLASPRLGTASGAGEPLAQDPPSTTLTPIFDEIVPLARVSPKQEEEQPKFPEVRWNRATSHGLPYAGWLSDGTQLPLEGPSWVTWNPVADHVPNRPDRLYGNERTIRKLLGVLAAYRAADHDAPQVVVGDISFRTGGPMELHQSHQNGLDVDVYYPRRDGALRPPTGPGHVDRRRSQALLDGFLAAGVERVFVGYTTGLDGPGDVMIPYPNHGDHMHVRFRP
jgi:hypothetical protein